MTAEEKKLSSWERSRLDSMPWERWQEMLGISENEIIEKGLGKDLAQGRFTSLIRVYANGDDIRLDGDVSLRAYQKTKDGEFHIEAQGVRDSLYIRSVFGKEIPEAMQNDLKERGSAGPLELNGRQQFLAVNPYTKAVVVCPASSLESELQRRSEVFGHKLSDDDKAVLAKGGVVRDVELEYNGQKRTGDIHFDAFRQCLWAVDRNFAEKIGAKKAESQDQTQKAAQKAEQKAGKKQEESEKKSRGVHM